MEPCICGMTVRPEIEYKVHGGRIRREYVGDLVLESGAIAGFDPICIFDVEPFDVPVPSGKFQVFVWIAETETEAVCAGAYVAFGDLAKISKWEPAVGKWKPPGRQSEYGVDSGYGGFADNLASNVIEELSMRERSQFNHSISASRYGSLEVPGTGLNVVYFASGRGDGSYKTYIGLGEDSGNPGCILTDFRILQSIPL